MYLLCISLTCISFVYLGMLRTEEVKNNQQTYNKAYPLKGILKEKVIAVGQIQNRASFLC